MIRVFCLIAIIVLPAPLFAQETPVSSVTLDHIALSVQDVDRSVDFYRNIFGLTEITNRTEVDGIRWLALGEGKELHLISVVKEPVSLNKALHFAVTTPEFDGFVEVLRQSRVDFSNWAGSPGEVTARADGTRQIYIQDPDGNWIEVNSTAAD